MRKDDLATLIVIGICFVIIVAVTAFIIYREIHTCNSPEITQTEIRGIVVEKNIVPVSSGINWYLINIDIDGKVFYIKTTYETYTEIRLNTKYTFEKRGSRWYAK